MNQENDIKLYNNVIKKIKEMNVDSSKDILELIYLLQDNEMISRKEFYEYPINRISESLGIAVYSEDIEEDGYLYVDGTTEKLYGCNQVILTSNAYSSRRQREIRVSLLGVYLLDYLKKIDGDHSKVYIAAYNKTNMDNKARFFAGELLTPTDIFVKQYNIAVDYRNNPIYTRAYLREYFDVTPGFIDDRIHEIAYDIFQILESTNPQTTKPKNNIIVFRKNYK